MTHYVSPDVPNCCENQDLVFESHLRGPDVVLEHEKKVICVNCGFFIVPRKPGDLAHYIISRLELKDLSGERS